MQNIPIHIAVEDPLSEAVVRKLLSTSSVNYHIGSCFGKTGFGYLKSKINGFNKAAQGNPFFVLTDLDTSFNCAPELVTNWITGVKHPNLIFRVAVKEVETWLLADKKTFSTFLKINQNLIPQNVEAVIDPKQTVIELAKKSPNRDLREDIVPPERSTRKQGPNYNNRMIGYVNDNWNILHAIKNSQSLLRAYQKIESFNPTW